jgi:hypothetical protein
MTSEEVLASIDHHYTVSDRLTTSQLREHQARGSCITCDLRATAERNPRWIAAGRPMLTGSIPNRHREG